MMKPVPQAGKWAAIRQLIGGACALALLAACQSVPTAPAFNRAQTAVLAANGFVQTARGWELSMADRLLFASDESKLKPDQLVVIANIGAVLAKVGITRAQVEGHADATGSKAHNERLSHARAIAVASQLRASGIALRDEQVLARGEAYPVGDNRTAEGRADNRRVVIIVTP